MRLWLSALDINNGVATSKKIHVYVDITNGVAVAPPLGNWMMDYCEGPNTSNVCAGGFGHAEVSPTQIKVYQKGMWDDGVTYRINQGTIGYTLSNGEVQSGMGIVNVSDTGPGLNVPGNHREMYSKFSFKPNFYLARVLTADALADKDICYDRRMSNGYQNVWETWLYNNDPNITTGADAFGSRLNLSGGFSIKKNQTDETTRGWASYWGVWFPDAAGMPADGDTLYSDQNNQQKIYTYKKSVGQLTKNLISKKFLDDIDGVSFNVWLKKSFVTTNSSGTNQANTRIHWNSTTGKFVVEAVDGDNTGVNKGKNLTITELIQANANGGTWLQPNIWGWQEGSPVNVQLVLADGNGTLAANGTPGCASNNGNWSCSLVPRSAGTNATTSARAILKTSTRVVPGSTDAEAAAVANLICTGSCIGANGQFIETNSGSSVSTTGPVTYSYSASTGALSIVSGKKSDNTNVSTGAISAPTSNNYWTQALIPATDTTSLALLTCSSNTQFCGWLANEKLDSTYFSFGVGSNRWDYTEFLLDNSTSKPYPFQPPVDLTYTINQTGSPMNGQVTSLQYQGNGNLSLPGHCIDRYNTSKSRDCSSGDWSTKFYVNDFVVPPWTGTLNDKNAPTNTEIAQATLTKKTDTSKTYLAKWLRKGVLFSSQDATTNLAGTNCAGMTVPSATDFTLPTPADWKNPADPTSSNYIGAWQDPTGNPVITNGVFSTN